MDHLVEPDDGGVVQQLHHLHLALHLLQVHRVQLRLVDDLDRHLKCSLHFIIPQFHFIIQFHGI